MADHRRAADVEPVEHGDEIGSEAVNVVAAQWVIGKPMASLVDADHAKVALGEHAHLAIPELVVETEAGNQYHDRTFAQVLHVHPYTIVDIDKCHFRYHLR